MTLNKIAIIPARSGSKGLPNKNILMLLDKPLIAYTIEAALKSGIFARVIVSTDSLEYKAIAERYGAEVHIRNSEIASDTATSYMVIKDVLTHCCDVNAIDYFMLLQPTSPFRSFIHIRDAVNQFEQSSDANFLVSVTESNKSSDLIKPIDSDLTLKNFDLDFSNYRRQDSKEYTPNGAIFIGKVTAYFKKKHFFGKDSIAYIMNKRDSVDIDDRVDFDLAIAIQSQINKAESLNELVSRRINEKRHQLHYCSPITLIGHSIFDYWNVKSLGGREINNLGIAGINSKDCFHFLFDNLSNVKVGNVVLLFAGTNDIVLDEWSPEYTITWTDKIIELIHGVNSETRIFFLSIPPVRGRIERNNSIINDLNITLMKNSEKFKFVTWVPLSKSFYDEFGNLYDYFTNDGLHFSASGYQQLEQDILEVL